MLYLSIAIMILGLFIFVYSIVVDTKNRKERIVPRSAGRGESTRHSMKGGYKKSFFPDETVTWRDNETARQTRGVTDETDSMKQEINEGGEAINKKPPPPMKQRAVLYEDALNVINYNKEGTAIDPGWEGYKNIRRVGSGEFFVEKGGVNFFTGKKLYRYDFHRIRDIKSGEKHLAFFLRGSEAVKLFIFDAGFEQIAAVNDAYRDYMRSSGSNV